MLVFSGFCCRGFRFVVFPMGLFVGLTVLFAGVAFLWVLPGMVLGWGLFCGVGLRFVSGLGLLIVLDTKVSIVFYYVLYVCDVVMLSLILCYCFFAVLFG